MATYMNQTNSGRIIVQQTSPSAIIVQPDNERKIILKGSGGLKGETGEQGPAGPQGEQGPQGPAGQPGPANTLSIGTVQKGDTAEATITGDAPNQTLNLTLPKGDKGDTGSQGPEGSAATITVGTTSTLPEGSSATVTNSGTSSAAVFNFGIPKGDKGDTGETGETGPTGPAGPGVATGGTAGQVLTKKSGTDYDTEWTTPTTYSDFTGATSSVAGAHGLVPAPTTSDPDKFLKGDGTWGTPPGATYTGGTGIDIVGNVVSVDNTVAMQSDLPTKTSDLINDGSDNTSTYVEADELATVATSGSYNDLLNKPTIPTVNDATLTIQKNGTTVETFTANSSSNKTANITVPTKTSDLTNDGSDNTSTYVEADELQPSYIEGEGTSITFPSTQGAQFKDTKLKGNSGQSGSNVLTLVQTDNPKGLTVTANTTTNTITYGGTTNDGYPWINGATGTDMPMSAGTFVISIDKALTYDLGFRFYNSSGQFPTSTSITAGSKTVTVAVGYDIKKVVTLLSVASGVTIPNTTIKLTMTPTSPTPAYPITVQTVTGEQTISIIGKNLFEVTPSNHIVRGTYVSGANTDQLKIAATGADVYLNEVKAAGSSWDSINQGNLIPCEYGETFYFNTGNTNFSKNLVTEYDENKISLGYYSLNAAFGSFSTRYNGCKYFSFRIGYGDSVSGTTYTLAPIVARATISGYEPYTNQEFKINLSKNIVDLSMINVEYGIYTETGALGSQSGRAAAYKVPVKPNTSYIATCAAGYQIGYGTTTYGANGAYTGSTGSGWVTTKTYTTDANTYFISFVIKNEAGTSLAGTDPATFKLQMEEGSTSTAYTPHVELCKIGNYQDYIYQSGNNWYIHKVTGKKILNGTEAITSSTTATSGVYRFKVAISDCKAGLDIPLYSSHFTQVSSTYDYEGITGVSGDNGVFLRNSSAFNTTAALQTWLSSNSPTVYYPLTTATDTQITGSIADQLNALANATGYSGTTTITATVPSPDLPAILSLSAALPSALPLATTTSAGTVSVGDGLEVDTNGRLSALGGMTLVKTLANSDITAHSGTMAGEAIRGSVYKTNDGKIGILYITQIRFDSAATGWLTVTFKSGLTFSSPGDVAIPMGFVWNYSANGSNLSASSFSITSLNADGTITAKAYNDVASTNLRWWGAGAVLLKLD